MPNIATAFYRSASLGASKLDRVKSRSVEHSSPKEDNVMPNQTELTAQRPQAPAATHSGAAESEPGMRPPVDVFEDADGLTLLADLPGVSKERLDVRVEGDTLIVEGDVQIALSEQMQAVYADIRSTHYQRRFALSDELQAENIEASLKDGVLTVRIPKRAETKPRRIEVRTQ
jgi:HSP20 family protein